MAITEHARTILELNKAKEISALGSSRSAVFGADAKGGDYKTLLMFANAGNASATATIAVGNGIQGAGSDLVITVAAGKTMAIVVDSGYWKNVSGEYKDFIKITPSAALTVTVIELPQ